MPCRRLLLLALWAGFALASSASAVGGIAPVELVSPRSGATLLAGSEADLEWAPLEPFARLADVEEWEAFLSFDGGATYPVRITPHLDRDLRHVRWLVPGVPTSDARLLLRLGDERREIYLEMPQRFSIAASPGMERAFTLASAATAAGEPALPGRPGVVAWVEGSRRGGSLRQVVAPERPAFRPAFSLPESHHEAVDLTSEDSPVHPPALAVRAAGGSPGGLDGPIARPAQAPSRASDILLLTKRQNE
ncbi:MAG TPA: hypothetical protein VKK31_08650 [Thermoanaerobaculia bacterium]|nr:hypothetical protein [Thermoanaerobaculia bacterium]